MSLTLKVVSMLVLLMLASTSMLQNFLLEASPPKNIVLVYTDAREGVYMTKDQLLPLVVYLKDSKAVDTFFDGFLFLGISAPFRRKL